MIVDAHVHLPVMGHGSTLSAATSKLLSDMAACGVDYAVVIPDNIPDSASGDMEACLKVLEGMPRLFLLGTVDVLTQGRRAIDRLQELMESRAIKGVKLFPGHDPVYPTDERLMPIYHLCRGHGLPVVIHTGWNSGNPQAAQYNDPRYIVEIARGMPDLRVIISHYFWPRVDYCYEVTCSVANISYDTSALADDEVIRETGLERIREVLVRTVRDKPKQVLFGSDYAMCAIGKHIDLISSLSIAPDQRNAILFGNAVAMFRLEVAHGGTN
jgi:hypothetical protein